MVSFADSLDSIHATVRRGDVAPLGTVSASTACLADIAWLGASLALTRASLACWGTKGHWDRLDGCVGLGRCSPSTGGFGPEGAGVIILTDPCHSIRAALLSWDVAPAHTEVIDVARHTHVAWKGAPFALAGPFW